MESHFGYRHQRRTGHALAITAVLSTTVIGAAALSIDVGLLMLTKADLQRTADSAALAGASAYGTRDMRQLRKGENDPELWTSTVAKIRRRAQRVALLNGTPGRTGTVVLDSDLSCGRLKYGEKTGAMITGAPFAERNAVEVVAGRKKGNDNGAVALFFAWAIGVDSSNVSATATATYIPGLIEVDLWPFSIERPIYDTEAVLGNDDWSYDPVTDTVFELPDGIPEIVVFPSAYAAGNFAALHIGGGAADANELSRQILNGPPKNKVINTFGTDYPLFEDGTGMPITYSVPGSTGVKAAIEPDLLTRVGDIVSVFLHEGAVLGGGSTADFNVVGLRYVRVMHANLASGVKGVWVQPVDVGAERGVYGQVALTR